MRWLAAAFSTLFLAPAAFAHEGLGLPVLPFLSDKSPESVFSVLSDQQFAPTEFQRKALPMTTSRTKRFTVDEASWASVDLSRCSNDLVFDLLGDLYLLPAEQERAQALTHGLAVDSQPVFSPDCRSLAFVSDRSGAENVWMLSLDDSSFRPLTRYDNNRVLVSPEWAPDGSGVYVSRYLAELGAYELLWAPVDGGEAELLVPARDESGEIRSVLGVSPTTDGRYLYYAAHGGRSSHDELPEWQIHRLELATGATSVIVAAPPSPRTDLIMGTAFRPRVSPDGRWLVYGARRAGKTGLKRRDLHTGRDDWLVYPVQQDQSQASHWRDILPRHAFSSDGSTLVYNRDGRFYERNLSTGEDRGIAFQAEVELQLGPETRVAIQAESGPVRSRVVQHPAVHPDGDEVVYTAFGYLYRKTLKDSTAPERLTGPSDPQFHPVWSPDGSQLAYVTWTAGRGGQLWLTEPDSPATARAVSALGAYLTNPVFTPGGKSLLALRSSNEQRMQAYMEYGGLRQAELVEIPLDGGEPRVITQAKMGGALQFGPDPAKVLVRQPDGLHAVDLRSGEDQAWLSVTGAGWYFAEGQAAADELRVSPDGRYVLALNAQQLHLVNPGENDEQISLLGSGDKHFQLTRVGADFVSWSDDGESLYWAVGSSLFRLAMSQIPSVDQSTGAESMATRFDLEVSLPRQVAPDEWLLRGGNAITMDGEQVIHDADILVRAGHIAYVEARGVRQPPQTARVLELDGAWVVPGFVDSHDHVADVRRDVLDFNAWGFPMRLAYGVTTAFDPSTLSIDMLIYQDLIDAGQILGPRLPSTGPAIFSFNNFTSRNQVRQVLRRYREHYRLSNIKVYRSGNRRVRQWLAQEAQSQGLLPTTEGALAMKLDLSQILDGFAGHEHALPVVPLAADVQQLLLNSGVSYTPTLQIGNGGAGAQDDFIVRYQPLHDPKVRQFMPPHIASTKFRKAIWREQEEYLYPRLAADLATLSEQSNMVAVGTHGEVPGLGVHWEMEVYVDAGGMTPHKALRAATLGSAKAIGRDNHLGSLEAGKLADLLVLDRNPLEDIRNSRSIRLVMKGGALYRAQDLQPIETAP